MGRPAEGGAPAPAHAAVADVVIDRDEVPGGGRVSNHAPDFASKLWCHPLVGVDFEDPLTAAGLDPDMPARPLALPCAFDEALGEGQRDLPRAVTAAVEHDDGLVGKAEAGETIGELAFFVMGHDQRGKRWLAHAAALSTECHSRRAAARAAPNAIPSIKVPVLRWSKPGPNIASGGSAERTHAVRRPHGAYWATGLGPNSPRGGVREAGARRTTPV